MISRMKFINIIAPKSAFERVVSEYVMESEIELENPMLALRDSAGFVPSTEGNPAEEIMKKFTEVFDYANVDYSKVKRHNENFSKEELVSVAESFDTEIHSLKGRMEKLEQEIQHSQEIVDTLTPVVASDVHLENLQKLEYLKFRFGRMPVSAYSKLDTYLKDLPSYFVPMTTDRDFVWGIYFVTKDNSENVDRVFGTLYFERFWIEGGEEGTPAEIIEKMNLKDLEQIKENSKNALPLIVYFKILSINKSSPLCTYYNSAQTKGRFQRGLLFGRFGGMGFKGGGNRSPRERESLVLQTQEST